MKSFQGVELRVLTLTLSQANPTATVPEVEDASKTSLQALGAVNALGKGPHYTEAPTARPTSLLSAERRILPVPPSATTSRNKSAATLASVFSTPPSTTTSAHAQTEDSVISARTSTARQAVVQEHVDPRRTPISTSASVHMRTREALVPLSSGTAGAPRARPVPTEPRAGATTLASSFPISQATPPASSSSALGPPPKHPSADQTLRSIKPISPSTMQVDSSFRRSTTPVDST